MITNGCLSEMTTIWNVDNRLTTKIHLFAEKCVETRRTQKHGYEGIRVSAEKYEERTLIFPTMKSMKD